jgi:hypothetical protein
VLAGRASLPVSICNIIVRGTSLLANDLRAHDHAALKEKIEDVREEYLKERRQLEKTLPHKPASSTSIQKALGVHNDETEWNFLDDEDVLQQFSSRPQNEEGEESWEEIEDTDGPVNVNKGSASTSLKIVARKANHDFNYVYVNSPLDKRPL